MLEVAGFEPFLGLHCETAATGSLLKHAGHSLSEPMLFGLGEGLGFIFLNLKALPLPFLGGRSKPFTLTEALCRNLGLSYEAKETSSPTKALQSLEQALQKGQPVGLQLDSYFLEYFSTPIHFAGHCVAVYGLDAQSAYVVDTAQQGSRQKTSRQSLEAARFAKGQMAAKARSWTIQGDSTLDLPRAAAKALHQNATAYLSPAFKGMSFYGLQKLSESLPHWISMSKDPKKDLSLSALLMEKAGTGGALFRNFYRDFLSEVGELLPKQRPLIAEAHAAISDAAKSWSKVSALLTQAAEDTDASHLREASEVCARISTLEVSAMTLLSKVPAR